MSPELAPAGTVVPTADPQVVLVKEPGIVTPAVPSKRPILVTAVAGTWAWRPDDPTRWWQPTSAFSQYLFANGYDYVSRETAFVWSTDENGVFDHKHSDWKAGGANLFAYLVPPRCPDRRVPPAECNVIAHSHGGQVALYAASMGLKIDMLITVATPVRGDMVKVIEQARPNIRHWRHIHGSWKDYVQVLGSIGDGTWGIHREFTAANENILVRGCSHSEFLSSAAFYPRWVGEWLPKEVADVQSSL